MESHDTEQNDIQHNSSSLFYLNIRDKIAKVPQAWCHNSQGKKNWHNGTKYTGKIVTLSKTLCGGAR
jgi:hypothetical protein